MYEFLIVVGFFSCLAGSAAVGYVVGSRRMRARWRKADERLARITDERTPTGEPHNYDGAPARVTQGRIRNRRNWTP